MESAFIRWRCYSRGMSDPSRRAGQRARSVNPDAGGVQWKRWALGIAVLLLAIIIIQNSQTVPIKLLVIHGEMPLIVGLLIAGALGAIVGYITPLVRRGRREEHHKDQ